MAKRIASTSSLSLSARAPDLDNLPISLSRSSGRVLGVFLIVFASFWGGIPMTLLLSEWESMEGPDYIALVFPAIGLVILAFGLYSLFCSQRTTVDRTGVSKEIRRPFRRESWHAPLTGYRGVLKKTVLIRRNKSTVRAHAVLLAHRGEDDKTVPIFVSTDAAEARRQWERAAKAFDLVALEETAEGEVARRPEDLDKSVRELAAEGKLKVDFEARPPPPALTARYEGEALVVTTAGPIVPKRVTWGIALALVVVAVVFSIVGVILAVALGGWLGWDRFARERLTITAQGVGRSWLTPWGERRPAYIAAGRIEAVNVVSAESRWLAHLEIVADDMTLSFARGRPAEALEWAREAVLSHVAT